MQDLCFNCLTGLGKGATKRSYSGAVERDSLVIRCSEIPGNTLEVTITVKIATLGCLKYCSQICLLSRPRRRVEDISTKERESPESAKGCLTLDLGKLYTSSRAVLGNLLKGGCLQELFVGRGRTQKRWRGVLESVSSDACRKSAIVSPVILEMTGGPLDYLEFNFGQGTGVCSCYKKK